MQTQKARGIVVMKKCDIGNVLGAAIPTTFILQHPDEIHSEQVDSLFDAGEVFARPCPTVPRHGFVDSRVVAGKTDALQVFNEALREDPGAELILMNKIDAATNAIYTGNYLSVGPGHDGATSGKGSLGFRIVPPANGLLTEDVLKLAGVSDTPYFEIVHQLTNRTGPKCIGISPYVTQLRDGPAIESVGDLVPEPMVVKDVYEIPEGAPPDALWWETFVKSLPSGTAVYHPGGTPASHYAVHCALSKVPCIFSHRPKIGEHLTETIQDGLSPEIVRDGARLGLALNLTREHALKFVLFALHQYTVNQGEVGSKMIGIAASLATRLAAAACLGEVRHKRKRGRFMSYNRAIVHENAWTNVIEAQKMMGGAMKLFFTSRWRHSYGGPKWGSAAAMEIALFNSIVDLERKPTVNNANAIIAHLNNLINAAHNGGWLFNKFIEHSWMDIAVQSAPSFIVNVAPIVYRVIETKAHNNRALIGIRRSRSIADLSKKFDLSTGQETYGSVPAKPANGSTKELVKLVKLVPSFEVNKTIGSINAYAVTWQVTCAIMAAHYPKMVEVQHTGKHFQWKIAEGAKYFSANLTGAEMIKVSPSLIAGKTVNSYSGNGSKYVRIPSESIAGVEALLWAKAHG